MKKYLTSSPVITILSFAALTAVFLFTVYARIPVEIRTIGATVRYSFITTSIGVLVVFYLILRLPEKWRVPLAFAAGGAVFGLALTGLWASGQSEPYVVSGLIPYNDAATYYNDANRLLDGSLLSETSSRRPLSIGFLGALLGLTGRNLQNALAVLALIEAAACVYMMLEIRRAKGPFAGALTFWIIFLFARRFIGTTMTESLGLAFGALSLAFFCRGTFRRSLPLILAGLFLLTVALNIRAGAFFILPLLILWVGWLFRIKGWIGWKPAGLAALAVIAGFGVNSLVLRLVGTPGGMPFGNFAESLYGLASGGERWSYVYTEIEEARTMPEKERFELIYRKSFELIRQNPMGIVQGSLYQWSLLFSDTWFSVYAYVGGENAEGNRYIHWALYALCAIGLVQSIRKRREPLYSFLLVAIAGIFLSVPFVPPGDAHKMRAFAATIPLLALLPAIGLSELANIFPWKYIRETPVDGTSGHGISVYSTALTAFLLIAPYIAMKTAVKPVVQTPVCLPGETPVNAHYAPGTSVRLIREDVLQLDWLPEFHFGRYKVFIHNLPNDESIAILSKVEPPATLMLGYDITTGKRAWILTGTEKMPQEYGILQMCGNFSDTTDPDILRYGFYYPREIRLQN
ncbi:hypothetical protein hrd7_07500 [Leptolinea sp. HRD-7]|nr:hypothetical protein hrd7_07500 [Leptolinea sp. HRD-7]